MLPATTEIVAAAHVEMELRKLVRSSAGLDPDSFVAAYQSFLKEVQRDL